MPPSFFFSGQLAPIPRIREASITIAHRCDFDVPPTALELYYSGASDPVMF
jgi:hypothetical protein